MPTHEVEFSVFPGTSYVDLMPYQYGREACSPGHAFGPARRSHYLFHYVISGAGTLMASDRNEVRADFRVGAGEGFLIFPQQVSTYVADMGDPWEYIWVEFDGLRVGEALEEAGLGVASPVYRTHDPEGRDRMLAEMRRLVAGGGDSTLALVGHTYLFLDALLRSVDRPKANVTSKVQDFYLREAINFIVAHYQEDITVEDIARQAGLNRSYFGKVFKAAMGKSPQQYLIGYRMNKAAELLKLTALSVGEVGRAVGYPNQLHFSRAFKNVYGTSPREWRKHNARG